jgi:hypothetical protein
MARTPKIKAEDTEHSKPLVEVAHEVEAVETREQAERAFKKIFSRKLHKAPKRSPRPKHGHAQPHRS